VVASGPGAHRENQGGPRRAISPDRIRRDHDAPVQPVACRSESRGTRRLLHPRHAVSPIQPVLAPTAWARTRLKPPPSRSILLPGSGSARSSPACAGDFASRSWNNNRSPAL
jgi:hypothetical protein